MKYIEHKHIKSSVIDTVRLVPSKNILYVKFKTSEAWWKYTDVPKAKMSPMLHAESIGSYFNMYIKNEFKYEKLTSFEGEEIGQKETQKTPS